MEILTEEGGWARLDPVLLAARISDGRDARRREAGARRRRSMQARKAQANLQRAEAEERLHIRQTKKVMREFGLLAPVRAFGPRIRIRAERRAPCFSSESSSVARRQAQPVPIVRKPSTRRRAIIDLKGRESVFVKFGYLGLSSPGWAPGKAAAHARYVHEHDRQWGLFPLSNMGQSVDEIAACWDAIEAMEQEYRANAKIQLRVIGYLPPDLSFEQMRQVVQAIGEREFGALGLPWSASIHPPKPGQNNWHFHIDASMRPFERLGENDWVFASEKISGIDDPDGLKQLRGRICGHLNHALFKAGSARRYTHLSYAERGIAGARRQQHLGSKRAAAVARGEPVALAMRNAEQAAVNHAAFEAFVAAAKLEAAGLDLAQAELDVEAAATRRSVSTLRQTVEAACSLARMPSLMLISPSVDALRQHVADAQRTERAMADLSGVALPLAKEAIRTADHAIHLEQLARDMAPADPRQKSMVAELARSIEAARAIDSIDVRVETAATDELGRSLAVAQALHAVSIPSSASLLEMVEDYRSLIARTQASLAVAPSDTADAGTASAEVGPSPNAANASRAAVEAEALAPAGKPIPDHEQAALSALGAAQQPSREALIDAAHAIERWASADPVTFADRVMAWREDMAGIPRVHEWIAAWDASDSVTDDDVQAKAKALLRDKDAIAQVRAQARLLEIIVRLCLRGDPEQFAQEFRPDPRQDAISNSAVPVAAATVSPSSPSLAADPAPQAAPSALPNTAIYQTQPSAVPDASPVRPVNLANQPQKPVTTPKTQSGMPAPVPIDARKPDAVPTTPPKPAVAINLIGHGLLFHLTSSGVPTHEVLTRASQAFDRWYKQEPEVVERYCSALVEALPRDEDIIRWFALKMQKTTATDPELAALTRKLLTDDATMALIRKEAALLELVMFRDVQRSSAAQASSSRQTAKSTGRGREHILEEQASHAATPSRSGGSSTKQALDPKPISAPQSPDPHQEIVLRALAERALSGVRWDDANYKKALMLNAASAERLGVPTRVEIAADIAVSIEETIQAADAEEQKLRAYCNRYPDNVRITPLRILLPDYAADDLKDIAARHSRDPDRRAAYAAIPRIANLKRRHTIEELEDIAKTSKEAQKAARERTSLPPRKPTPVLTKQDYDKPDRRFPNSDPDLFRDPGRELVPGIYPKLDEYRLAEAKCDDAARRRAAEASSHAIEARSLKEPTKAPPQPQQPFSPNPTVQRWLDQLDEAARSKNRLVSGWAKAIFGGRQSEIKRMAQLIRNDDEAERAASALHPSIMEAIIADAPNRHVREKRSRSGRSIGRFIERDFGLDPD